jgi:hypothetical protein
MEGIFSLPYSEYETILQIQRYFRKTDGFAVLVPVSRQQKGIDFLVLNTKNRKSLRVQVKGSRSYSSTENTKRSKRELFKFNLWFNNFVGRYEEGEVDVYILFGLYPVYTTSKTIKSRTEVWRSVLLAFGDKEMKELLSQVKTKKEHKTDRFFGISGNDSHSVFGVRGFGTKVDLSHHLLENKVSNLLADLR